jgi:hypothetical protein
MEFDRFDEVPQYLTKKIVMEHEAEKVTEPYVTFSIDMVEIIATN